MVQISLVSIHMMILYNKLHKNSIIEGKNGICKKPEGGTVTIRTERRGQDIILTVQDTGERVIIMSS